MVGCVCQRSTNPEIKGSVIEKITRLMSEIEVATNKSSEALIEKKNDPEKISLFFLCRRIKKKCYFY